MKTVNETQRKGKTMAAKKVAWPNRPESIGACNQCGKALSKETAKWCGVKCRWKYYKIPSGNTVGKWARAGLGKATDGCRGIESDGECPHGHPSWVSAFLGI
jgi:hypothetical protein